MVPAVARVLMLGEGTRPLGSGVLKSTIALDEIMVEYIW